MTAFQMMARSEREITEECDVAEKMEGAELPLPAELREAQSPTEDRQAAPTLEQMMDKAGVTQFDEPVAAAVVRDIVNADADAALDESYCEVSPKPSPIEKVDNAWRSWGWFFNP